MKISIIVPVYNKSKYLSRCIESLINQTFNNIEIILIDDGSYDNSLDICNEYAKKDCRVVVISQENAGPSRARNVGIEKCNGEWIIFVDADDSIEFNMCEVLYNKAVETNADMVVCNLVNIFANGQKKEEHPFKKKEKIFLERDLEHLEYLLISKESETGDGVVNFIGPTSKLIRKEVINDKRFPVNISLGEDTCFIMSIFENINKVVYIDNVLYNRYMIEGSLSNGYDKYYGERLAKFTNWIKCYYKNNNKIFKYIEVLEMKHLIWVVGNYLSLSNKEPFRRNVKKIEDYMIETNYKVEINKIVFANICFKQKMILFLVKFRVYGVLKLLFLLKA